MPAVTVAVSVVMPMAVTVSMVVSMGVVVAVMGIVAVSLPVRLCVPGVSVRLLHETPSFRAGQGK
ncbi:MULTISPECIES: hypothetical protein [Streptomyces]|uniref:hypothetical protein n=1 Tax=Streptomyces TaxID=1883 RepID=UPI00163C2A7D|nr:hypothetical protein [Streptomyces sp. TYQ1024]